jgi:serine/threonine protein phosphatase PrpC
MTSMDAASAELRTVFDAHGAPKTTSFACGKRGSSMCYNVGNFIVNRGGEDIVAVTDVAVHGDTKFRLYVAMDGHGGVSQQYQDRLLNALGEFMTTDEIIGVIKSGDVSCLVEMSRKFATEYQATHRTHGGTTVSVCAVLETPTATKVATLVWGDSDVVLYCNGVAKMFTGGNADDHSTVKSHVDACRALGLPIILPSHATFEFYPYLALGMVVRGRVLGTVDDVLDFVAKRISWDEITRVGYPSRESIGARLAAGEVVANPAARYSLREYIKKWNAGSLAAKSQAKPGSQQDQVKDWETAHDHGIQAIGSGAADSDGLGWSDPECKNPERISPNMGCIFRDRYGNFMMQPAGSLGDHSFDPHMPLKLTPVCEIVELAPGCRFRLVMGSDGLWDVLPHDAVLAVTEARGDLYKEMRTTMLQSFPMNPLVCEDLLTHDDVSFLVVEWTTPAAVELPPARSANKVRKQRRKPRRTTKAQRRAVSQSPQPPPPKRRRTGKPMSPLHQPIK